MASLSLSPSRAIIGDEGEGDLWVRPMGRIGDRDTRNGIFGFEYDIAGISVGASKFVSPNFALGGGLGFTHTDTDKNVVGGTDSMDAFYLGFYGDYSMDDGTFLNFATSASYNDYSLERYVMVNNVQQKGEGDPNGFSFNARIGGGKEYDLGGGMVVRPTASVSYLMAYVDGYTESGLGQFNLNVDSHTYQDLRSEVAVEFEKGLDTRLGGEQAQIIPFFRLGLMFNQPLDDREGTANFVGFGNSFSIVGDDQADAYLTVGLGLSMSLGDNASAFVGYDGDFNPDTRQHTVNGGFRFTW
jgi:outer membrane autotransporter protein